MNSEKRRSVKAQGVHLAGKISPLAEWLARRDPLFPFQQARHHRANTDYGGFLSIDLALPLHESVGLSGESLESSWKRAQTYIRRAMRIIDDRSPGWLDSQEVQMIQERLGPPPSLCYPLYLITVKGKGEERLVYVGKTSSEHGRFKGGHAAITKLHHPDYNGLQKTMYLAGVVLLGDAGHYLPLEWVRPLSAAVGLLDSIERQLIFQYKPELNTHGVLSFRAGLQVRLQIDNGIAGSEFLEGESLNETR